jgi:hypothetical protein
MNNKRKRKKEKERYLSWGEGRETLGKITPLGTKSVCKEKKNISRMEHLC